MSVRPIVLAYDDHEVCDRLVDKLQTRIEDLEHELRLARRHLDVCDRWEAVTDHDRDKAASNQ